MTALTTNVKLYKAITNKYEKVPEKVKFIFLTKKEMEVLVREMNAPNKLHFLHEGEFFDLKTMGSIEYLKSEEMKDLNREQSDTIYTRSRTVTGKIKETNETVYEEQVHKVILRKISEGGRKEELVETNYVVWRDKWIKIREEQIYRMTYEKVREKMKQWKQFLTK